MNFSELQGVNRVLRLSSAESTQDAALELARGGAPEGFLVLAETQTAGRGRLGHSWHSAPGGIYMSLVLRPGFPAQALPEITLIAARSCAKALSSFGIKTRVKKPNDVLAFSRGKYLKIAGVLAETSVSGGTADWAALGLGVNLNNKPPSGIAAASAVQVSGKRIAEAEFLKTFFGFFWPEYEFRKARLQPSGQALRQ